MRKFHYLMFVFCMIVLLGSCKPGVPNKYIQPSEMANILYEYHLADAVVNASQGTDSIAMRAYQANILEKYKVTQSDFDSSMVYYSRHTNLLEDVYKQLSGKIESESMALGINGGSGYGQLSLSGDTANVWKYDRTFVLSPHDATNSFVYEIKADTSYYAGDALALDFDAQFLYQDGIRSAVAVMAVYFEDDSVAVATSQMSSSSHYHLQISNEGHLKIKGIKGFWLLNEEKSIGSATTLKIMIASNIRLIRMHKAEEPSSLPNDTTTVSASQKDSLENADGLKSDYDKNANLLIRRRKGLGKQ